MNDFKSTQYLYDCEPTEFMSLPYQLALKFKIVKCKELLVKLRKEADKVLYMPDKYTPILTRYLEVDKAKLFNEKLLDELVIVIDEEV